MSSRMLRADTLQHLAASLSAAFVMRVGWLLLAKYKVEVRGLLHDWQLSQTLTGKVALQFQLNVGRA